MITLRSRAIIPNFIGTSWICLPWWQSLGERTGLKFLNWVHQNHLQVFFNAIVLGSTCRIPNSAGLSWTQWFAFLTRSRRCWCNWLQHTLWASVLWGWIWTRTLKDWRSDWTKQLFRPLFPWQWVGAYPVWRVCPVWLCSRGLAKQRDSFCGYLFVCYLLTLSWASEGPCIWILISLWSLIQNQATMGRFLCSFPLPVHRIFSSPHWIYIFKVSSFRCQVFRVQFYSVLLLSLYFFWFHL